MNSTAADAGRRQVVVALGFGQLLAWGSSYYLLATLARPMASGLGLEPVWVYAGFSGGLLVAALMGPWAGARIDRSGGRKVLLASNLLFALALGVLGSSQGPYSLLAGWLIMGVAMPMGLYDAAFSTVVALYGAQARSAIVGITLIAGLASSVSWPLTAWVEALWGWRAACLLWALLHLSVGAALHRYGVPRLARRPVLHARHEDTRPATSARPSRALLIMAAALTANGFVFAAMATHLPHLLEMSGCAPAVAISAAALVGVAQIVARLADAAWLGRLHPLIGARLASSLHPVGAVAFGIFGAPVVYGFTALHGAGVGLMTIVKGTLPLALFGVDGFGRRAGWLEAPARVAQALAPLVFGVMVDGIGASALWISAAIAALGALGMFSLRRAGWRAS